MILAYGNLINLSMVEVMKTILMIYLFSFSMLMFSCKTQKAKIESSETKGIYNQNCPQAKDNILREKLRSLESYGWKSLFASDLAKKMVERYMTCSGKTLWLSKEEFKILSPGLDHYDSYLNSKKYISLIQFCIRDRGTIENI